MPENGYDSDPAHRARSMNHAVVRHTRGRVTKQVDVETLAALILSAQACAYCQGPLDTFGCAVDHVIPLLPGSRHTPDNLAMACGPCNRAKSDLLPSDPSELQAWLMAVARRFPPT